jgi:large subunit ribosomal protein L18
MAKKSRNEARKRRHNRVRRKIIGTAARPRLNIYRSLTNMYAQVIDDEAGHTLVAAASNEKDLAGHLGGKSKTEAAALVGKTVAERALNQGINEVVFDRGGFRYHGRVKALADAAREAGLKF